MTTLNLKKMPQLPADADAYLHLSGRERLEERMKLVDRGRVDFPLSIMSIALLLAAIPAASVLWAVQPAIPNPITVITLLLFLGSIFALATMTIIRSGIDPEKKQRAWRELFDYVDKTHPASLINPNREHRSRGWLRFLP